MLWNTTTCLLCTENRKCGDKSNDESSDYIGNERLYRKVRFYRNKADSIPQQRTKRTAGCNTQYIFIHDTTIHTTHKKDSQRLYSFGNCR